MTNYKKTSVKIEILLNSFPAFFIKESYKNSMSPITELLFKFYLLGKVNLKHFNDL